jgi:hypothetical protein
MVRRIVVRRIIVRLPAIALSLLFTAALWAQVPAASGSKPLAHSKAPVADAGALSDGVYRNPYFGFSCKLPYGWVDRTREMQDDSPDASNDASKSLLLLAIFERPPEATGETINSAAVIAAERLSAYSSLKTAANYFGQITELTTAKGFHAENDPHDFSLGTTHLVRGDFSKTRGTLTMRQSSLVMVEKGYVISFTFIAGSEDEISELIEKLSFAAKKPHPTIP